MSTTKKVQPLTFTEVKSRLLADPETYQFYLEEKRADEMRELLASMRAKAGLTSTQIAERMGVSQPAVSKLERNATRASLATLQRYANACGAELKISFAI